MADRSRRVRRPISDMTEESPDASEAESEDYDPRRAELGRRTGRHEAPVSPVSRSKRSTALGAASPQSTSNADSRQSIKLTMKVAPSKLREVMRANEVDSLKDTLGGGKVLDGPRSRRSATQTLTPNRLGKRLRYLEAQESDLDDGEQEEEEEEDNDDDPDDAEGDDDMTMNDFTEVGAEAEGGTDDEDVEMDDDSIITPIRKNQNPPKPPKITLKTPARKNTKQPPQPSVIVTPADVGPVQSVEDEEMEDDLDDEEEDEDEEDEEEELEGSELPENEDETNLNEEDVEGDEEEEEEEEEDGEGQDDEEGELDEDDEGEDDEDDDSDEEDELASGAATPDPNKMTSRQRGRPVEPLLALDMAPQQRKFFTDEEKAMKKDEHARKRKELTKRKTQEEKAAALNRLLKPQVSKSRGAAPKAETLAAQMQAAAEEVEYEVRAEPLYTRWVSTKDGIKLGVPDEWLGKKVGQYFGPPLPASNGALVQEMD